MSFKSLRNNVRARFAEPQVYINYLLTLEPKEANTEVSLELKIMRGLFYVHLYGVWEKSINEIIENTILFIRNNSIQKQHLSISFSTVSLARKLQAFRQCDHKRYIERANQIFIDMKSTEAMQLDESIFSAPLQNVWAETVVEVLNAFGIDWLKISPRTRTTIDELVTKRNEVAHGRESAATVGERFRSDILRVKMDEVIQFVNDIIDLLENFYAKKSFLKSHAKKYYELMPF